MSEMRDFNANPEGWQQVTPLSGTAYKVDIDAPGGAQIRFTRDGMAVYMLHSDPGVYLNDHNKKIPPTLAAEAGFDIAHWARLKKRNDARRLANQAIDLEFDQAADEARVVASFEEYAVVEIQEGVCNITFDGEPLNVRPVSLEVALRRFEELTGVAAPADASQPVDAEVAPTQKKR
jgi:hypothetical protein